MFLVMYLTCILADYLFNFDVKMPNYQFTYNIYQYKICLQLVMFNFTKLRNEYTIKFLLIQSCNSYRNFLLIYTYKE